MATSWPTENTPFASEDAQSVSGNHQTPSDSINVPRDESHRREPMQPTLYMWNCLRSAKESICNCLRKAETSLSSCSDHLPNPVVRFYYTLKTWWNELVEERGQAQKLCPTLLAATLLVIAIAFIVTSHISIGGCDGFPLNKPYMELIMTVIFSVTSFVVFLYLCRLVHASSRRRNLTEFDKLLSFGMSFVTILCFGTATMTSHGMAAYVYDQCTNDIQLVGKNYTGDRARWDTAYNGSAVTFVALSVTILCLGQLYKIEHSFCSKFTFIAVTVSTGLLATVTFANEVSDSSTLFSWYSNCPNVTSSPTFTDQDCKDGLLNLERQNAILFPMTMEYCLVAFASLYDIWSTASTSNSDAEPRGENQEGGYQELGDQEGGDQEADDSNDYYDTNDSVQKREATTAWFSAKVVLFLFFMTSFAIVITYAILLSSISDDSAPPTSHSVTLDHRENRSLFQLHPGLSVASSGDGKKLTETARYFNFRIAVHSVDMFVMLLLSCEFMNLPKLETKIRVSDVVMSVTALGITALCFFCIAADIICIHDTTQNHGLCKRGNMDYFNLEWKDYLINAIESLFQAFLVIKLSRRKLYGYRRRRENVCRCRCLPGLLLFLFVSNGVAWGADSFVEVKIHEEKVLFSSQLDVIGGAAWRFITQLLYPLAIFFRFHSAALFFEAFLVVILKPGPSVQTENQVSEQA